MTGHPHSDAWTGAAQETTDGTGPLPTGDAAPPQQFSSPRQPAAAGPPTHLPDGRPDPRQRFVPTGHRGVPPPSEAYRLDRLSFGDALRFIRQGSRCGRAGWESQGMFVFLVAGSSFAVNRWPLLGIYPEGTEIRYHGHIDQRAADGTIMPWQPSQADMLSDDWTVLQTAAPI